MDSSFFSAPKPKQKLPSFKKAPASSAASATSTARVSAALQATSSSSEVAQPNAVDPFQEALAIMGKGRAGGNSATPEPSASANTNNTTGAVLSSSASGVTKPSKKRKSVTWAPENQLVKIRVIEKAVYDDDPAQVCIIIAFMCSPLFLILFFFYFLVLCCVIFNSTRLNSTHGGKNLLLGFTRRP